MFCVVQKVPKPLIILSVFQIGGLGKIKPNTLIMGFLGKWKTEKPQNVMDYVGIIQ